MATPFRSDDPPHKQLSLPALVRDFNAENRKLERGLDQPPLTEDEVVAAIRRTEFARWHRLGSATTGDWMPGEKHRTEREFAVFQSVAETGQLPPESYFVVWTREHPSEFVVEHLWTINLFLPSLDGDGFDGFAIRHTKVREETIDPDSIAWGRPGADGMSLGAYLSPRKIKYALGERVRLLLFVRNEGQGLVPVSFPNTSHPLPEDFHFIDQNGARLNVANGEDANWKQSWLSGFVGGELGPGDVHRFEVPFEISLGGDGSNKLIGRVVDARPGQLLRLSVSSSTGSNREQAAGAPAPMSGVITFVVGQSEKRP